MYFVLLFCIDLAARNALLILHLETPTHPSGPSPNVAFPGEVHLPWWGPPSPRRDHLLPPGLSKPGPCIWRSFRTRRDSLRNLLWHPEQGLAHSRLSLNVCWRMCSHQNEYMRFPEEINTFQFLSSLPCWFQCGRQIHLWVLVSFFSSTLRADGTLFGALHGYHTHWLRVKA